MTLRCALTLLCVAGNARAGDACSALFQTASPALQAGGCDQPAARRELERNLNPACLDAVARGQANDSMDELKRLLDLDPKRLPCASERTLLLARAACISKSDRLRDWIESLSRSSLLDPETRALCRASAAELRRASAAELRRARAEVRMTPAFKQRLRWRIGAAVTTLVLSVGVATAIGLTRDRDDLAWLAATHFALAAVSTPVCAYLTGASGGRFTSILWLVLGIPGFAAAGTALGYLASSSPAGRVVLGTVASGLSLATVQAIVWTGLWE